ncbi:cyanophycin synthetase [Sterolibacterium denitrificans]|nr:cyanophycin synthetase [Sterolibacterium denitrificans]
MSDISDTSSLSNPSNPPDTSGPPPLFWRISGNPAALPGFRQGLRQPALAVGVRRGAAGWPDSLDAAWRIAFPHAAGPEPLPPGSDPVLMRLLQWNRIIQRAARLPIYEDGHILRWRDKRHDPMLLLPGLEPQATLLVVRWLERWSNRLAAREAGDAVERFDDELRTEAEHLLTQLKRHFPQNTNSLHFVDAAHALDIPWQHLGGGILQFGQGRQARRMDSSFTDATGNIASRIARHKALTGNLLRRGGLPGSAPLSVTDADAAVATAERIGYPVVIKPADLDGGVGVAAGLGSADEVRQAFEAARKHTQEILLEKHFHGRDYRLSVLNGRLLWAIERVPGGVRGDGVHTVQELVDETNRDPRRSPTAATPLYPLELDDEAKTLLAAAGLDIDSVPASGRQVTLRRTANVSRGGYPVAVNDQVHADNRALAERATRLLGLDLAGIDLLIPDIATSWRESGALICEVNGQPQFNVVTAGHLYAEILGHLLHGDGRIPSIAVLGRSAAGSLADDIAQHLAAAGLQAGLAGVANGPNARIGAEPLACPQNLHAQGNALLLQPDTDALILQIADPVALEQGLPCDRIDHVLIAADADDALLNAILPQLLPACRRSVIVAAAHACVPRVQATCARHGLRLVIEPGDQGLAVCAVHMLLAPAAASPAREGRAQAGE